MSNDQREEMVDLLLKKTLDGDIRWRYRPDVPGVPMHLLGGPHGVYTANVTSPSGRLSVHLREQPQLLGGGARLDIRSTEPESQFEVEAETQTLRRKLSKLLSAAKKQRKHVPTDIMKVLEEA